MKKYTEVQIKEVSEELDRVTKANNDVEMYKRLKAVLSRMKGIPAKEVAKETQFSVWKIWYLCNSYTEQGLEGLTLKYHNCGGHNRILTAEKEAEIFQDLTEKALEGKYNRTKELKKDFEEQAKAKFALRSFYTIIKRNKWRTVVPRSKHPKRPEASLEDAKKLTLKRQVL